MKILNHILVLILSTILLVACATGSREQSASIEQLLRLPYVSQADNKNREFFVYLPRGYETQPEQQWPVLLFLHGNGERGNGLDRKSTRLNSSHVKNSYAVFCLKKKKNKTQLESHL